MFSSTTIASSTTIPMASTSASIVRMLTEYPMACSTMNVPMIDTRDGHAGNDRGRGCRAGTQRSRAPPGRRRCPASARPRGSPSRRTSIRRRRVSGSPPRAVRPAIAASSAFTPCATSIVLALDCLTMPRNTVGRPLKRATVRSSSTPLARLADIPQPDEPRPVAEHDQVVELLRPSSARPASGSSSRGRGSRPGRWAARRSARAGRARRPAP